MEATHHFEEQGYFLARGVFAHDEIGRLSGEFDRIVDQVLGSGEDIDATWSGPEMQPVNHGLRAVLHTHNVHRYSARWHQALLNDGFLEIAESLMGPNIVLHHTKLLHKPARQGSAFPVHQDWPYFPTLRDTMIGAVIHVSDANNDMGCLRLYPGSHRLGRIADVSGQTPSSILQQYPLERAVGVEAKAGDVLFFNYLTLHGSMPNVSDRARKTVLVQMYAGDDQLEPGNRHPNEQLVLRGWNFHATRNGVNGH